jgi:hypothetical protein
MISDLFIELPSNIPISARAERGSPAQFSTSPGRQARPDFRRKIMTQISIHAPSQSSRFHELASAFLSAAVLVMSVIVSLSFVAQS